jgi:hypothetical protein
MGGSAEKISFGTPEKKERVSEKVSERTPSPQKRQKVEEKEQSQGMEIETKSLPKFKAKPQSLSSSCNNSQAVKQKLELGSNNEFSFNGPNAMGEAS